MSLARVYVPRPGADLAPAVAGGERLGLSRSGSVDLAGFAGRASKPPIAGAWFRILGAVDRRIGLGSAVPSLCWWRHLWWLFGAERAACRRIDALAAVVPADPVTS